MKKRILSVFLLSALILTSLTGCEGNNGNKSQAETTANTELAIHRRREDYSDVNEACADLIETYYDGLKTKDYDKSFSVFPDFYQKAMDAYLKALDETKEQFMDENIEWYNQNIGSDYKIELKINKVLQLVDSSLLEYQNTINSTFRTSIKLDDGYAVETSEVSSGSNSSVTNDLTWYVFEINGEYFLYESFFESNSVSE